MIRLTVTFDSGRSCSGTFPDLDMAEDFAVALVDCCEDVSNLDFEVIDDA